MDMEKIAKVCHAVNRAYKSAIAEEQLVEWDNADDRLRETVINGVKYQLETGATPEQMHRNWCAGKMEQGWEYGKELDEEKKLHPCLVAYADLPPEQKVKDYLFSAIVNALKDEAGEESGGARQRTITLVKDVVANKGYVPIRYIGRRDIHTDNLYGTGLTWMKGETKLVPEAQASMLLKHADVYEPGEFDEDAGSVPTPVSNVDDGKDEEEDAHQDVRDAISQMTGKRQVLKFIKETFGIKVEDSAKKSVDALKSEAISMVDQFGLPEDGDR